MFKNIQSLKSFMYSGLLTAAWASVSSPALADDFTLTSNGLTAGQMMPKAQEYQGFGCGGGNLSPQLAWSGEPEGTNAYALFVYDPDAPTGSGWWHWQLVNIPGHVHRLATGAGEVGGAKAPKGSQQMRNDYGEKGFGGACPPEGDKAHRYQFTLYALPKKLDIPADASAALTGFMVKANALGSATLETFYQR